MNPKILLPVAALAWLALLLGGCAETRNNQISASDLTPPASPGNGANPVLHGGAYPGDYTFDAWFRTRQQLLAGNAIPDPAIVLSFSGGFVHAAAVANYVLEELADFRVPGCSPLVIPAPGATCKDHSLVDHVILISSTSGGGFANANFIVNGAGGIQTFDQTFARSSLAGTLLADAALDIPGWLSVIGPVGDRSPYLIDVVDDQILHRLPVDPRNSAAGQRKWTFGDLSPMRPFAVFGGTDYAVERHFTFTQESFDDLCSDLSKLPLSTAVAASGAFPFLLTDVELRNHWADADHPCPLPASERNKFRRPKDLINRYDDKQAYLDQRYSDSLRRTLDTGVDAPFRPESIVHLFDGGVSDNLAVRPLTKFLDADHLAKWFAGRTILYLQVNARTDAPAGDEMSRGSPWVTSMATGIPYDSIDNDTSVSSYMARAYWRRIFGNHMDGSPFPVVMYMAEVDFDDIADQATQVAVKKIGAGFSILPLSPEELSTLRSAAVDLMEKHPCFTDFLAASSVTSRSSAIPVPSPADPSGAKAPKKPPLCGALTPGGTMYDTVYDPTAPTILHLPGVVLPVQ